MSQLHSTLLFKYKVFEVATGELGKFLLSDYFRSAPSVNISSIFLASLAREIRGGRGEKRYPGAGMFNDIALIASYARHCDAMFIDNEMLHFSSQAELRKALTERTKFFSLKRTLRRK